jgi:LacI family transcriptional regulator
MARVTLQDVAAHAGVSRATASMVVRDTGRLSPSTRQRVRDSMDALGYVYHRGAATLRTRRSGIIGLLITDVSNPFFAAMTLGFDEAAGEGGYLTMMTDTFDDPERQTRLAQSMLEHPIDALAYTPVVSGDLAFHLENFPVPILAVTRGSTAGAPYLGPDDLAGGEMAADHLVAHHRYRKLIYLGGPRGAGPREDRLQGIQSVIQKHAGAELVADFAGTTNVAGGIELANELLASGLEFDAVICHSDVVAYALLAALRKSGRGLDSTGILGFDDLPESEVFWPSVTSIGVGPQQLGRLAAEWLLRALDGDTSQTEVRMPPTLHIRRSCGCGRESA